MAGIHNCSWCKFLGYGYKYSASGVMECMVFVLYVFRIVPAGKFVRFWKVWDCISGENSTFVQTSRTAYLCLRIDFIVDKREKATNMVHKPFGEDWQQCQSFCFWVLIPLRIKDYSIANIVIMIYLCHRKQGEKIGCYRFIGTPVFGVQGGRDATLFFFYASAVP